MTFPLTKEMLKERPLPMKLVERLQRELTTPTMLSERELDVLALVACGHQAPEIGKILHLSQWTIASHQKNIRLKLGAQTLAHAVALAIIHGHLDVALVE